MKSIYIFKQENFCNTLQDEKLLAHNKFHTQSAVRGNEQNL